MSHPSPALDADGSGFATDGNGSVWPAAPAAAATPTVQTVKKPSFLSSIDWAIISVLLIALFVVLAYVTENQENFMVMFMIFVLAIFTGYMVIWNVIPALHTPLMSVTNAISGIIVIGAMLTLRTTDLLDSPGTIVGMVSVFLASINIWGGFIVTQRMLNMFRTEN